MVLQRDHQLKRGTVYHQVRPTRLDKIENLRTEASADVLAVDGAYPGVLKR